MVECRRVLKWTYAYGYYLPEEESARRQFFEYLQGEADSALENLHKMAEKELEAYLDPPLPSPSPSAGPATGQGAAEGGAGGREGGAVVAGGATGTVQSRRAGGGGKAVAVEASEEFTPLLPFNEFRSRLAGLTRSV